MTSATVTTDVICDAACEVACPLMQLGRVCPSIAEARAEMRELMTSGCVA